MARSTLHEQLSRPESAQTFEVYEDNAATSLSGEFRGSLAGYLWGKTDEYLHGGMLLRAMTAAERDAGAKEATSADNIQSHHGETSVIPEPNRDARGFWGDIERNVKPYFDVHGHKHRNVRETLPLYRFLTWADPTFVPGYYTGAYVLYSSDHGRIGEVLNLLAEGIRYNPRSVVLHVEYARYAYMHGNRSAEAKTCLTQAIRLGRATQPNETEKDAVLDAYRWLVLIYRKEGSLRQAETLARVGAALYPGDPVFTRTLGGAVKHPAKD